MQVPSRNNKSTMSIPQYHWIPWKYHTVYILADIFLFIMREARKDQSWLGGALLTALYPCWGIQLWWEAADACLLCSSSTAPHVCANSNTQWNTSCKRQLPVRLQRWTERRRWRGSLSLNMWCLFTPWKAAETGTITALTCWCIRHTGLASSSDILCTFPQPDGTELSSLNRSLPASKQKTEPRLFSLKDKKHTHLHNDVFVLKVLTFFPSENIKLYWHFNCPRLPLPQATAANPGSFGLLNKCCVGMS